MADLFDERFSQKEAELRAASKNLAFLNRLGVEGFRRLPLVLIVLAASLTRGALCKSIWDVRAVDPTRRSHCSLRTHLPAVSQSVSQSVHSPTSSMTL